MVKWANFTYENKVYSLEHLHPFVLTCVQEAQGDKPERKYVFAVIFSLHCFTDHIDYEETDKALFYSDKRETRAFCFIRYELSKRLPDIVNKLDKGKIYHTTKGGNFFTVEVSENNESVQYEIYFEISKSSNGKHLNLFIQSGYLKDKKRSEVKNCKRINFFVIAYNRMNNKVIRVPPK